MIMPGHYFNFLYRYLMKHGASVAAVNNDGDLPMDIAENDEMEKLLKEEMDRQGKLLCHPE